VAVFARTAKTFVTVNPSETTTFPRTLRFAPLVPRLITGIWARVVTFAKRETFAVAAVTFVVVTAFDAYRLPRRDRLGDPTE
jgi:hypothetical protein